MQTTFSTGLDTGATGRETGHSAATAALNGLDSDRVDFAHVFSSAKYDHSSVIDGVRAAIGDDARILGCSAAGEFTEAESRSGSVVVALITSDTIAFNAGLGRGLSDDVSGTVQRALKGQPAAAAGKPHRAAILLHDGLSGVGEELATAARRELGEDVLLTGGSAGDDLEMEETVVSVDGDVASDAVAIATLSAERPMAAASRHGHDPISDALVVTAAEGNQVLELDDRPAIEVWKTVVREPAAARGIDVDTIEPGTEAFQNLLTQFEFGIDIGAGHKMRWPGPTTSADGPIEFSVSVPEGTVLRVMGSNREDQLETVRRAGKDARSALPTDEDVPPLVGAFVYDCVCRDAILGDEFADAVAALSDELEVPFAGFETYGEICVQPGELSGYHNTTAVVLTLPP